MSANWLAQSTEAKKDVASYETRVEGSVALKAYFEDHFWALIDKTEVKLTETKKKVSVGGAETEARMRRSRKSADS